ncbi:MAG: C25 family cysteine peptidase [Armatimonadetes bacterium]|nr:C25 family cysteine peptidase [Armatimonadota bacterium]
MVFRSYAAIVAALVSCAFPKPGFADRIGVDLGSFNANLIESKQVTAVSNGANRRIIEQVTAPGFSTFTSSGNPALPCKVIYVALPPDADESSVKIQPDSYATAPLAGAYDISPVPAATNAYSVQDWGRDKHISNGRNLLVYKKNAFYPEEQVSIRYIGHLRTWKIAAVEFWPYCYNPVTGQLRAVSSSQAALSYSKVASNAAPTPDPVAAEMSGFVSNSTQAQSFYPTILGDQTASVADYVIITTSAIATQSTKLAMFAAFQASRGFTARIVTESNWGGGTGAAAANNIRAWLQANYLTLGIKYVLLVGNPNPTSGDVPMKMLWPRLSVTTDPDDWRQAPSDYFYADLTGNWDLNGNGSYGDDSGDLDTGGVDRIPEVYVGRIPYYGVVADLDHILQKTMDYESGILGQWSRTFLLPMKPLDVDPPQVLSYQLGEEIKRDVIAPVNLIADRIYDGTYNLNPPPEHYPCDYPIVLSEWQRGAGFVFWMTHGATTYAASVISSDMCSSLDDTKPAIVYAASCDNGWPEEPNNLGYALLRSGAVSTQTASRVSWYFSGETTYTSAGTIGGLGYQYAKFLLNPVEPCGRAAMDARLAAPMTIWANDVVFNVYGDPSLAYNGTAFGAVTGRVTDTAGVAIAGACIRSADGRKFARSRPDGSYMLDCMGVTSNAIVVSADGYYSQRYYDLPLGIGNVIPMDFQLVPAVYGSIAGHVYDAQYAPISGASVSVSGLSSAVSSQTDGSYVFPNVEPGDHTVTVSKSLYAQKAVSGCVVAEGQSTNADITLQLQIGNALLNGGFEAGFSNKNVANGWSSYHSNGYTAYPLMEQFYIYDGKYSQGLTMPQPASGDAHAGFYQTVTVLPGGIYKLSAMERDRLDGDDPMSSENIVCRLGYDPLGGNDYSSSNVVWQQFDPKHLSWNPITDWAVTATTSDMTIFLDVWRKLPSGGSSCYAWFDNVILDGAPPPVPVVSVDSRYQSNPASIHAAWSCPGPNIIGYECAVSATSDESGILPGGGWLSVGTAVSTTMSGLTLQNGDTARVLVKAHNSLGATGEVGSSDPIRIVEDVLDVASAKRMADGTWVRISGVRTSRMGGGPECFIEDSNRNSGIKVTGAWTSIPYVGPGTTLAVAGRMDSLGDLRVLSNAEMMPSTQSAPPQPIGLANRLVGGGDYQYVAGPPARGQKGTPWGRGVNNVGLLVAVWGNVIASGSDWFTIWDGTLPGGLTITCLGSATPPAQDSMVRVVGISAPYGVVVCDSADILPLR